MSLKDLNKDPMSVFSLVENEHVIIDGKIFIVEFPVSTTPEEPDGRIYFTLLDKFGKRDSSKGGPDSGYYAHTHFRLSNSKDKHNHAVCTRLDVNSALTNPQGPHCNPQFLSYIID